MTLALKVAVIGVLWLASLAATGAVVFVMTTNPLDPNAGAANKLAASAMAEKQAVGRSMSALAAEQRARFMAATGDGKH